ncbi:MAG: type II toxin-antitoxin system VapC family toxin [Anaerolineae bacterium]|nr:type II toxin-antitoxin system VapC family toxin [Anaerolineae bacterium]
MPEQIVIDTDIIIDALYGNAPAIDTLAQIETRAILTISVITEMELVVGLRNKSETIALDNFLARFQIIPLDEQISNKAVELLRRFRLSHGLLIQDALIAATASSMNFGFVTKNIRDFRFINELRLLPYPDPFTTQGADSELR